MGLFISSVVGESWRGLGAQENGASCGPLPLFLEGAFSPGGKGEKSWTLIDVKVRVIYSAAVA